MRIPRAVILLLFSGLSTLVQAGEGTHKLPPLECLGAKGKIVVPAAKISRFAMTISIAPDRETDWVPGHQEGRWGRVLE
jgi:hypothetical protein